MEYKFEHITTNSTAKKLPEESDREHYIGLEHLDTNCFTISRWGSDITPVGEKLLMKKGDVLFGKRRAYQRKVGIAPFDGIFSAHGMVLRPKEDVIDKDFFPFFINSDQFMERAIRISVGGLSPTINWKDLKEQVFELPSLEEQKVLASKLWAAYNLKESYKTLLAKTDEMVKSRFIEITQSERTQLHALNKLTSIERKNVNPIRGTIYTLYSFPAYDNNRIPEVVDGGDIKSSKLLLTSNTVLYNKLNVRLRRVWNIKELKTNNNICSSEFIPLKVNKDVILQEYLMYCLTSDSVTEMMESASQGTSNSQQRISTSSLMQVSIPVIPKNEQNLFIELYQQSDKSKFELKQAIEKIDKVMRALLQ